MTNTPGDTTPAGTGPADAMTVLNDLHNWSYTIREGSRIRALIQRTERAETALRHLWSSLAWQHQEPHTPECMVCAVHDEVRGLLRDLDD